MLQRLSRIAQRAYSQETKMPIVKIYRMTNVSGHSHTGGFSSHTLLFFPDSNLFFKSSDYSASGEKKWTQVKFDKNEQAFFHSNAPSAHYNIDMFTSRSLQLLGTAPIGDKGVALKNLIKAQEEVNREKSRLEIRAAEIARKIDKLFTQIQTPNE